MTAKKDDYRLTTGSKTCADCKVTMHLSYFGARSDRTHRPLACCRACMRERNRHAKAVSRVRRLAEAEPLPPYIPAPMFCMGEATRNAPLVASIGAPVDGWAESERRAA
jgi:hypothetical protein